MVTSAGTVAAPVSMPGRAAALILDAFLDYNGRFADVTRRARRHFARRDWKGAERDAGARIDLYDVCIAETLGRLEMLLDDRVRSRPLWASMRQDYEKRVAGYVDAELAKTFFNTLSRRFFRTRGVDPDIEFVALDAEPTRGIAEPADLKHYAVGPDLAAMCTGILADTPFADAFVDLKRAADALAEEIAERMLEESSPARAIQLLPPIFYRERRAYVIGRIVHEDAVLPLVIALVSTPAGVRADALLTNLDQISQLFGYTRNAFQADLPTVGEVVVFLQALMPHKPVGELFAVLGRIKQGKTERYRSLFRHLAANPAEQLVRADGERGMVMAVFTPRGYPVVIKVIRDHFAYPKDIARHEVEQKYRRVARYDRVGRLVDAQEFRDLRFPLSLIDADLLAELQRECTLSAAVEDDKLLLRHSYVERRLRPLNLFAREAPQGEARRAVIDYGQTIKDLARSNIFPGDLLLKNFGVSRIGRVIFYDYDELCLVEECRFRRLPQAAEGDETRPLEDWLSIGPNDIFPEQFVRFLGLPDALRDALRASHPEIFDALWWESLRQRFATGEEVDVPPYPRSARLPE